VVKVFRACCIYTVAPIFPKAYVRLLTGFCRWMCPSLFRPDTYQSFLDETTKKTLFKLRPFSTSSVLKLFNTAKEAICVI